MEALCKRTCQCDSLWRTHVTGHTRKARVVKKLVRPLRRCAIIVVEEPPESFAAPNGLHRSGVDRLGQQHDMAVALVSARPMVMHERLPEYASSGSLAHEDAFREALILGRFHPPCRLRIPGGTPGG